MLDYKLKNIIKYVVPTMLSNVCFFLFTVIDGIFIGQGVGTDGLGAVNIVLPFVLLVSALFMLINIGGVSMFAVRLGRGDEDGANHVFRQSTMILSVVAWMLSVIGIFGAERICTLLGANETFHALAVDYMFWYSVFIIPSGLSMGTKGAAIASDAVLLLGICCHGI